MANKQTLMDLRVVWIDCQTTGANPARGRLLEIAWRSGSAAEALSGAPAKPTRAYLSAQPEGEGVPRRIQAITGIRDEDMANAVPVERIRAELAQELDCADGAAVAHFAQFERPFLEELFGGTFPVRLLCTHKIAKKLLPNLPAKGVRGLAGYFGARIAQELKRAGCHVDATAGIWAGLIEALGREGVLGLDDLEAWLAREPSPQAARARKPAYEYPMDRAKRLGFSDGPGVYRMLAKDGQALYVGKATSLRSRVNSYFRGRRGRDPRKLEMLAQTWDIRATETGSSLEAALLESDEIKRLDPPYNICLKARSRALAFYSRDLSSASERPDEIRRLGPFGSEQELQPLLALVESLRTGEFRQEMFWDPLEPSLLAEGYRLFRETRGLPDGPLGARALLAFGLWDVRRKRRDERAAELAAALASSELASAEWSPETELAAFSDELDGDAGPAHPPTPEEIAEKYGRLLRRSARAYETAGRITRLLNSRVEFCDRGRFRTLLLRRGSVVEGGISSDARDSSDSPLRHPWERLGLIDYDRMRVLSAELARVRASGGVVRTEALREAPPAGADASAHGKHAKFTSKV